MSCLSWSSVVNCIVHVLHKPSSWWSLYDNYFSGIYKLKELNRRPQLHLIFFLNLLPLFWKSVGEVLPERLKTVFPNPDSQWPYSDPWQKGLCWEDKGSWDTVQHICPASRSKGGSLREVASEAMGTGTSCLRYCLLADDSEPAQGFCQSLPVPWISNLL